MGESKMGVVAVVVEALEERGMMSATPAQFLAAEAAAAAAAKQLTVAVGAYKGAYKADLKLVAADVKHLGKAAPKADKALLAALQKHEDAALKKVDADYKVLTKQETVLLGKVSADAFALQAKPTDTALQAKLGTDIAAFQSAGQALTSKFLTDVGAAVTSLQSDTAALGAANPSADVLGQHLQGMVDHAAAGQSAIQDKTAAAQVAVGTLLSDLTGG